MKIWNIESSPSSLSQSSFHDYKHAASCPYDVTNSTRGNYLWLQTSAEDILTFPCTYGGMAGGGEARRNCSDRGVWVEAELNECLTLSNSLLLNISNVCYRKKSLDHPGD